MEFASESLNNNRNNSAMSKINQQKHQTTLPKPWEEDDTLRNQEKQTVNSKSNKEQKKYTKINRPMYN